MEKKVLTPSLNSRIINFKSLTNTIYKGLRAPEMKMKKSLLSALVLLMLISTALPALALGPLDANADLTYMSKYVWRGMVANPEAVLQPGLSASFLGFGIGFWGNMDLTDIYDSSGEFTEIDWIASYSLPLPLFDLDFGFIYYDFPTSDAAATTEAYISASMGVLLSPSLAIYYDFKEVDGTYVNAAISHGVAMGPEIDLELGASLGFGDSGYNESYFGIDSGGMTDFLFTASVPFQLIPFFTVTPSVNYSTQMGDAKDSTDAYEGDSDAFFYGLSASFAF